MHPCIAISVQYNQLITVCPFKETQKKKNTKNSCEKSSLIYEQYFPLMFRVTP